jgi:multidrug efflux pump subunit AcrA (membrane-fusion protein)
MSKTLALACLVALLGCGGKSQETGETEAATPVHVAVAKREAIHHIITAEAVLYPVRQATIVPKINAPVAGFLVQRGDHVRQGQLLAVLENADLKAAEQESKEQYEQAVAANENTRAATMPDDLTKAKSDVSAARGGLDAAQKLYDNRAALFKEGALAQKLVDDAKVALVQAQSQFAIAQQHLTSLETAGRGAQMRGSQAQADAAKAHYQSAAAQASYAEVRSPIAGLIADRPLNLGEMASSSAALFSVVDISRVVARANVPVAEAAEMRVGQPATIQGPGAELNGKVSVVSPAVNTNTTTVEVWVEARNTGEKLKPGVTVQVVIDAGDVPNAVVVPTAALLSSDDGGEKVMIAGNDSLAHEHKVQVGVRSGDDVQILSGVNPDDRVITSGGLGLDDKARIEIAKAGEDEK